MYWSCWSIVRLYLFISICHCCVYVHIAVGEGGSHRDGPLLPFCLLIEKRVGLRFCGSLANVVFCFVDQFAAPWVCAYFRGMMWSMSMEDGLVIVLLV